MLNLDTHTHSSTHMHTHSQARTHIYLLTKTQAPKKCLTFFLRLYKLQLSGRAQHCHCPPTLPSLPRKECKRLCLCVAQTRCLCRQQSLPNLIVSCCVFSNCFMDVKVLLGYSAAKKKRKSVSLVLQQYDTRRGKSPGRKVKVGDMITPPTAQTAEPRCSGRDTSQVQIFCPRLQH